MLDLASHAGVITRAAEHMIRQHGGHAADFAAYRSRELRALGDTDAATLWAEVSCKIAEWQGQPARAPQLVD